MNYKLCHVIFSTNRLEYLIPTLKSIKNLNFENCDVHRIFIDDYPKTRNNIELTNLVTNYGFNEVILHDENKGLSVTWSEFWELIKDRDYDYVFHQEDDVKILEEVKITDLINLLQHDKQLSQTRLTRQAWYHSEQDPTSLETDFVYKNFRYAKSSLIFSPMASLYSHTLTKIPYRQIHNINLNEGMLGNILYRQFGMITGEIKNSQGKNIVEHIGEWFVGKRVIQGEPGYENFSRYNPDIKYSSRTGEQI